MVPVRPNARGSPHTPGARRTGPESSACRNSSAFTATIRKWRQDPNREHQPSTDQDRSEGPTAQNMPKPPPTFIGGRTTDKPKIAAQPQEQREVETRILTGG